MYVHVAIYSDLPLVSLKASANSPPKWLLGPMQEKINIIM